MGIVGMTVIKFRRLNRPREMREMEVRYGSPFGGWVGKRMVEIITWEIAFNEDHLWAKLNGEMAEIVMPAKSWPVRLWRRLFPLKLVEMNTQQGDRG